MQLSHSHADRLERFEEDLTADLSSAGFVVSQQAGFVAGSDLAHLDTRAILLGEVLDHRAEVDALGCGEIENDSLAAQRAFALHHFKLELLPPSRLLGEVALLPFALKNDFPTETSIPAALHFSSDFPTDAISGNV